MSGRHDIGGVGFLCFGVKSTSQRLPQHLGHLKASTVAERRLPSDSVGARCCDFGDPSQLKELARACGEIENFHVLLLIARIENDVQQCRYGHWGKIR